MVNPYQSPQAELEPKPRFQSGMGRGDSTFTGACIGTGLGLVWTAVFSLLTNSQQAIGFSPLVFISGFTLTGTVIGLVQRLPMLIGPFVGTLVLTAWALAVGSSDGWIVIWVIMFGGSGLFWGFVIGLFFWLVHRAVLRDRKPT